MIRKVSMSLLGIASLAFAWSCGSTPATNSTSANKPAASNAANTSTSSSAAPAPVARKAEFSTTPEALLKEHAADSKAMDKYKDKVVEITGKFSKNSGSGDALQVVFEPFDAGKDWVVCEINASAVQAAAKLEKGQEIKMTGIGIGSMASLTGPRFKDCQMAQ